MPPLLASAMFALSIAVLFVGTAIRARGRPNPEPSRSTRIVFYLVIWTTVGLILLCVACLVCLLDTSISPESAIRALILG